MGAIKKKLLAFSLVYLFLLYLALNNAFGINAEAYHKTFEGIEYRNDSEVTQAKRVELRGMFSNPLVGKSRFRGDLIYDDQAYTVDFYIKEDHHISIADEDNYTGANSDLGYLFTDEDMTEIVLLITEYDDTYHKGWNSKSGLIFSGHAKSRDEARAITREKLKSWHAEDW
jgi:hypothetical protein